MKSKGFISIYILPLFLTLIFIANDMVSISHDTRKITSNYMSTSSTISVADIGLKYGKLIEGQVDNKASYYVNIIDNNIRVTDNKQSDKYAKVDIVISKNYKTVTIDNEVVMVEYRVVDINSTGYVNNFSKIIKSSYTYENNQNLIDSSNRKDGII